MKMVLSALWIIARILLLTQLFIGPGQGEPPKLVARADSGKSQEEEPPRKPASSQTISSATRAFQSAVNGKAFVRNRCRAQGKDVDIEETAEVVQSEKCKLVVKAVKTTHPEEVHDNSSDTPSVIEFMIHADLSDLTTPVLVETQKFAQCDATGVEVLKVSSRSDPKKPLQVVRRAKPGATSEDLKQTRRDLSLFFADPTAAKRAANALDRAIKACGGKEWPDEDDLP